MWRYGLADAGDPHSGYVVMTGEQASKPMHLSAFWTAVWAGMAAPVALYAPQQPYMAYATRQNVGQSFALVGLYVRQAMGEAQIDDRHNAVHT